MKVARNVLLIIGVIFVLISISSALFTVDQTQQAVVTQFGKPVREITEPGLKIKIPFIQQVHYFDKRLLQWDGRPTRIPTLDKKYIWVDTCARWRINNSLKFLQSVAGSESIAQAKLDNIIEGAVRNYISDNKLIEIVRNSNRPIYTTQVTAGGKEIRVKREVEPIEKGREKITRTILKNAAEKALPLGIQVVDVRIKRINYVESVRQRVFERMIAERKQMAAQYRSQGEGEKSKILGDKEIQLKTILSQAYRESQEIKGKADAEATKIYAEAFGKDPEFYSFVKTLEIYKSTLDRNTWLILTTDSDYLKYLKSLTPRK
ncbi:protease modulator HflC [candidate division KSB1 bacterium]|nr:MAG: protease modulator HflC [candidate division KSB1 bacterium]RKY81033.1 MAG: protease modulator HflC [candidate division KSB1 bacterium]RKY82282.1 MAG: protease modulator HflC [candidate division KSB1 bacterium]